MSFANWFKIERKSWKAISIGTLMWLLIVIDLSIPFVLIDDY